MIIYDRQINRLLHIAKSEDCRYQVTKTTEVFFLTKSRCFFLNFIFEEHFPLYCRSIRHFSTSFFFIFFYFLKFFLLLWKTFYFYPGTARYCKCPGRFFIFFVTQFFRLLLCAKCGIRGAQKPPEAFCLWKTMSRHFRLLYTMNRFNIRRASNF